MESIFISVCEHHLLHYDFNINVNKALVRELEGTACAYRCWKRHDDGLADIS